MNIYSTLIIIIILVIIISLNKIKKKVIYEVWLFIQNSNGEFMLEYDPNSKGMMIPKRTVKLDEIPTKVVRSVMGELLPEKKWKYDLRYHFVNQKYDRVRDDVGPIYMFDTILRKRKICVLCYSLFIDSFDMMERKLEFPYPEFYNIEQINRMSKDIMLKKEVIDIIQMLNNVGKKYEYNKEFKKSENNLC